MDAETRRARFRACIAQYLNTELGASTPNPVARRLLQLDPDMIGVAPEPPLALIHGLRAYLEASDLCTLPSDPPPPMPLRRKAD